MSAQRYENPETKAKLDEARKELQRREQEEQAQKAEDIATARNEIASEEQPDGDGLPDLRVTESVEFRGHEFEFAELGDSELEASQFANMDDGDVEQGTEAGQFVYSTLGKASVDADEEYWRQYSLQASGDTDGVMDLFNEVIEAHNDVDPEAVERAKEFRG